jgi:N-methylhydantoinase A
VVARAIPARPPGWPRAGGDFGEPSDRQAYFGPEVGFLTTPVLVRPDLRGTTLSGPLIVEEYDATIVVPPGCDASLDEWGNVDIRIGAVR